MSAGASSTIVVLMLPRHVHRDVATFLQSIAKKQQPTQRAVWKHPVTNMCPLSRDLASSVGMVVHAMDDGTALHHATRLAAS